MNQKQYIKNMKEQLKKQWLKFYNSRVGKYVVYGLVNLFFWEIFGFQFAVIMALSIIIGEIHFKDNEK